MTDLLAGYLLGIATAMVVVVLVLHWMVDPDDMDGGPA